MKTFVITNNHESDRFSAGDVCDKLNLDCKHLPAIFLENNGKGMCYEISGQKTNLDADSRIKNAKKRREVGCGLAHRNHETTSEISGSFLISNSILLKNEFKFKLKKHGFDKNRRSSGRRAACCHAVVFLLKA